MSMRVIANIVKRDAFTVQQFSSRRKTGRKKQTPRKHTKLSSIAKRRLLQAASNEVLSAKQLKLSFNLPAAARRAQQVLHDTPYLKDQKKAEGSSSFSKSTIKRKNRLRRFIARDNSLCI